jgi:hypothetical protein
MKLLLTKNQSKGIMGKVSFEVKAQVELVNEEKKLIEHYSLGNEILFQRKMTNIWGQPTDHLIDVRVRDLIAGLSYKCKSLDEMISYSECLKTACETLKRYLVIANSFGGKEIFEF